MALLVYALKKKKKDLGLCVFWNWLLMERMRFA